MVIAVCMMGAHINDDREGLLALFPDSVRRCLYVPSHSTVFLHIYTVIYLFVCLLSLNNYMNYIFY